MTHFVSFLDIIFSLYILSPLFFNGAWGLNTKRGVSSEKS